MKYHSLALSTIIEIDKKPDKYMSCKKTVTLDSNDLGVCDSFVNIYSWCATQKIDDDSKPKIATKIEPLDAFYCCHSVLAVGPNIELDDDFKNLKFTSNILQEEVFFVSVEDIEEKNWSGNLHLSLIGSSESEDNKFTDLIMKELDISPSTEEPKRIVVETEWNSGELKLTNSMLVIDMS